MVAQSEQNLTPEAAQLATGVPPPQHKILFPEISLAAPLKRLDAFCFGQTGSASQSLSRTWWIRLHTSGSNDLPETGSPEPRQPSLDSETSDPCRYRGA